MSLVGGGGEYVRHVIVVRDTVTTVLAEHTCTQIMFVRIKFSNKAEKFITATKVVRGCVGGQLRLQS